MKQSKTFSLQNQKKIPLQDNHRFPETCARLLKQGEKLWKVNGQDVSKSTT
jgi:hypothetical protein